MGADYTLESAERRAILRALTVVRGNKCAAAALLDVGRTTLYRQIREHEIDTEQIKEREKHR